MVLRCCDAETYNGFLELMLSITTGLRLGISDISEGVLGLEYSQDTR